MVAMRATRSASRALSAEGTRKRKDDSEEEDGRRQRTRSASRGSVASIHNASSSSAVQRTKLRSRAENMKQIIEEGNILEEQEEDEALHIVQGATQLARNVQHETIPPPQKSLEIRRSLVAGLRDGTYRRSRTGTGLLRSLTIEQRAVRLFDDSSIVLRGVFDRNEEPLGSVQMTMAAKWKSWEASRGSLFTNERYTYFLNREVLTQFRDFDPFAMAPSLDRSLVLANVAGLVRIIDSPEDAADSLDLPSETNTAATALDQAWEMLLRLCTVKPWTDRDAIQLLIDLATQIILHRLEEQGGQLQKNGTLNPVVDDILSPNALERLQGWEDLHHLDDLSEKTIATNVWVEMATMQRKKLQRLATVELARQELTYEDFREEMLNYIEAALTNRDFDDQTQLDIANGVLPSLPTLAARLSGSDVGVDSDDEVMEKGALNEKDLALDGTLDEQESPSPEQSSETLQREQSQTIDESIEAPLMIDDVTEYMAARYPDGFPDEAARASLDEPETQDVPRQGQGVMTIAQAIAGNGTVPITKSNNVKRFVLGSRERVDWESQRQVSQDPTNRTSSPGSNEESPPGLEDPIQLSESRRSSDDSIEAHRVRARPRTRDHNVGHYAHQPDGDVARPSAVENRSRQSSDVQSRVRKSDIDFRLERGDEYLFDADGLPLHDERGKPLKVDEEYRDCRTLVKKQANTKASPSGYQYAVKGGKARWTRDQALFLYREVQKVPLDTPHQPTAYVYKRYHSDHFPDFNSQQVRDKMRDLVKQRLSEGRSVIGMARHYLPNGHLSRKAYDAARKKALSTINKNRQKQRLPVSEDDHSGDSSSRSSSVASAADTAPHRSTSDSRSRRSKDSQVEREPVEEDEERVELEEELEEEEEEQIEGTV